MFGHGEGDAEQRGCRGCGPREHPGGQATGSLRGRPRPRHARRRPCAAVRKSPPAEAKKPEPLSFYDDVDLASWRGSRARAPRRDRPASESDFFAQLLRPARSARPAAADRPTGHSNRARGPRRDPEDSMAAMEAARRRGVTPHHTPGRRRIASPKRSGDLRPRHLSVLLPREKRIDPEHA
ncbi:MAG: hypothetical protein R3F11_14615 [Verrucomicrobiales bacterium]